MATAGAAACPALALGALGGLGFPEILVPEILVMVMVFGFWAVPVIVILLAIRWAATRQSKPSMVASRFCGHCGQRIPDIGSFCPLCGERIVRARLVTGSPGSHPGEGRA
jgi:hypothetical protein